MAVVLGSRRARTRVRNIMIDRRDTFTVGRSLARPIPDDRGPGAVARAFPDRKPASALPPDRPGKHQRHQGQRPAGRTGRAPRGRRDHGRRQRVRRPFHRRLRRRAQTSPPAPAAAGGSRSAERRSRDRSTTIVLTRSQRSVWLCEDCQARRLKFPKTDRRLPDRGMDRRRRHGRGLSRPPALPEPPGRHQDDELEQRHSARRPAATSAARSRSCATC